MIEVFANDRQAAVAWHDYDPKIFTSACSAKAAT